MQPDGASAAPNSGSLWNLRSLAECLLETPPDAPINVGLARDLARAALVADDTLRRLSEWDAMNVPPYAGDREFWLSEIEKARATR